MNKNIITDVKRTVSQKVKEVLPQVLIEYLWKLFDPAEASTMYTLYIERLGCGEIQHIATSWGIKRVFGFLPVIAKVNIYGLENEFVMELVEEAEYRRTAS